MRRVTMLIVTLILLSGLFGFPQAFAVDRSTGSGESDPFALDTRYAESDLYLYPEDISWQPLGGGDVEITAMIHNAWVAAESVHVRILESNMNQNAAQATPIGEDQVIAQIDSGGSVAVQLQWTPPSDNRMLYVQIDPENLIAEEVVSNNNAQKAYQGEAPVITSISATWDGKEEEDWIGIFITGISVPNIFTAEVSDVNGEENIERVVFRTPDGTVNVEDTDGSNGWTAAVNMGDLTYPNTMVVEAYDTQGHMGSRAVYLDGFTLPDWLAGGGDASTEYMTFSNGAYEIKVLFPMEGISFEDFVPNEVLLLGALGNNLGTQLDALIQFGVNGYADIPIAGGQTSGGILQSQADEYGSNLNTGWNVGVRVDNRLNLVDIHGDAYAIATTPIPEVEHSWTMVVISIPVTLTVSIGGDLSAWIDASAVINTDLEFIDGTSLSPGSEIHVVISVSIDLVWGIVGVRFVAEPTAAVTYTVTYTTVGGTEDYWCGTFIIPYSIYAKAFWFFEAPIYSSALPAPDSPWEFGDCAALLAEKMREKYARDGVFRAPTPPDIFADPALAGGPGTQTVVVWVSDLAAAPDTANPEVYSMFQEGEGWSDPIPVTSNALFETSPTVAHLPDSRPMALWTMNGLTSKDSVGLAEVLENQEIYCSLWDANDSTWTDAVEITNDDPTQFGDGMAQAAFGPDSVGLCVWVRTTDDDLATKTDWEIYYSVWQDSTNWSTPAAITSDIASDCSPDVGVLPDGQGIAVWLRDADADFDSTHFDTEIAYAIWDGSTWSASAALSTSSYMKRSPDLAVTSSGRVLVTWVETVAFGDTAKADSVRFIASDPGLTGWGSVQTAYASDHFLQEPKVHTTETGRGEVAMVSWRGYDGYDGDLFASMHDLSGRSESWTEPTAIGSDTLTDWMATSAIDSMGNALFFSVKTDWSEGRGRAAKGTMSDGLSFMGKKITSTLNFGDELNFGSLPVAPDFRIYGEETWFGMNGDSTLYGAEGDTFTVHVTLHNAGDLTAGATTVRFYDAHPDSGGVPIGTDQPVGSLEPDTSEEVQVDWVATGGAHAIHAMADPDSGEAEQGESNNLAFAFVYITPDLAADSLIYSDPNPMLGDTLTITAFLSNHGGTDSDSILVRFFDGDPSDTLTAQLDLDQKTPPIPVGSSESVSVNWICSSGRTNVYMLADVDSAVTEADETDNLNHGEIRVQPDLAIDSVDVVIGGNGPDDIPVDVIVQNLGGVDAESLMVRFYDNDPLLDGVPIDSATNIVVTCFDSVLVPLVSAMDVDTIQGTWVDPPVGVYNMHVVADADSALFERNENNNKAHSNLVTQGSVDLNVSSDDLTCYLAEGDGEDTLHIVCQVHNDGESGVANVVVNFYADHPDSGNFLAATAIPFVAAGDSASNFARWVVPDSTGFPDELIYAFVDAWEVIAETNEGNNIAGADILTGVRGADVPPSFTLGRNYPNPFNPITYIPFELPEEMPVTLRVYNIQGRLVTTLVNEKMSAGRYSIPWRGTDGHGRSIASGIYLCVLRADDSVARRKMVLVR